MGSFAGWCWWYLNRKVELLLLYRVVGCEVTIPLLLPTPSLPFPLSGDINTHFHGPRHPCLLPACSPLPPSEQDADVGGSGDRMARLLEWDGEA